MKISQALRDELNATRRELSLTLKTMEQEANGIRAQINSITELLGERAKTRLVHKNFSYTKAVRHVLEVNPAGLSSHEVQERVFALGNVPMGKIPFRVRIQSTLTSAKMRGEAFRTVTGKWYALRKPTDLVAMPLANSAA